MFRYTSPLLLAFWITAAAFGHDTWVETNTNLVRKGDAIYLDLCLGNHGNDHRDFKLASKVELSGCTLQVIGPDGKSWDLIDRLVDLGYTPKEGYWQTKFATAHEGLHLAAHTRDKVVNHGRLLRSIKSAKAFFVVNASLDHVSPQQPGFERALGHPLEIVPRTNPVLPMGPGQPLTVQVMFHGKPFPGARISFIPRGEALQESFDERYERKTGADGTATFTPVSGDQYLIVVHHLAENEPGDGYQATAYSATMTLFVPDLCPCCDE